MDLCKRCSKCCITLYGMCKFLKGKLCSVYDTRLGRDLGDGVHKCGPREGVKMNYPGCPYNIEGQPTHPAYKENNG